MVQGINSKLGTVNLSSPQNSVSLKSISSAPVAKQSASGVAVSISAKAMNILAASTTLSTTISVANAIKAFKAAQLAGTLSNFNPVSITDSASSLTSGTNLADLSNMALAGKLAAIKLTDTKPVLTVSRTVATGDLSNPSSANGTDIVLQKITSSYQLNLTNVSASDALTIKSPSANSKLSISILDTGANIQSNLDQLENLAKAGQISTLSLSNISTSSTINISATQATNDIDVLKILPSTTNLTITDTATNISANLNSFEILAKNKILKVTNVSDISSDILNVSDQSLTSNVDAINTIKGNYMLEATSVLAADVNKLSNNKNIVGIDVVDTEKNIITNLSALNQSASNYQLMSVTLADKTDPSVSIADAINLNNLPTFTIQQPGVKLNILDTANNIISHARNDIDNIIANAGSISFSDKTTPVLTLADAKTLSGLTNIVNGTTYAIADSGKCVISQAKITNEQVVSNASNVKILKTLSIADAKTLTAIKSLDTGTNYSISDNVANILAQYAIKGESILSKAVTVNIVDTSANIIANLDKLEPLAKAGVIDNISITDPNTSGNNITINYAQTGSIASTVSISPFTTGTQLAANKTIVGTLGSQGQAEVQTLSLSAPVSAGTYLVTIPKNDGTNDTRMVTTSASGNASLVTVLNSTFGTDGVTFSSNATNNNITLTYANAGVVSGVFTLASVTSGTQISSITLSAGSNGTPGVSEVQNLTLNGVASAGSYSVSLSKNDGTSDTKTIKITNAGNAALVAALNTSFNGDGVTFTNSNGNNITLTYNFPGSISGLLTITPPNGSAITASRTTTGVAAIPGQSEVETFALGNQAVGSSYLVKATKNDGTTDSQFITPANSTSSAFVSALNTAFSNDNISFSNTTNYIAISADQITSDQDVVGKILSQVVSKPVSSTSMQAISNQFLASKDYANKYYLMPRAATNNGENLFAITATPISTKTNSINTYNVILVPQNRVGTIGYDAQISAGTVSTQGSPTSAVLPLLFNSSSQSFTSIGGLVKFNQTASSGSIATYNVTFNALTLTNSNAATHSSTLSQMSTTVSPTTVSLLSNLSIDSSKGETYSWKTDQNGFVLAWTKQASVSGTNSTYNINFARFDTSGNQIGTTTVLPNALVKSSSDISSGRFSLLDTDHMVLSDGSGGIKLLTLNTGLSSPSFKPDLDQNSYGFCNISSSINPDENGNNNSVILQYSGTKNGQNVVEYYAVNTSTMNIIGQSGAIATTSVPSKVSSSLTLGGNTVFGYQVGTTLYTQLVDGLGQVVSQTTTTLPTGVTLDQYRGLGNGQFEAIWRQPTGTSGANEIYGQLFDTRGKAISTIGSGIHSSTIDGTSGNDQITVVTNGSIVEGGAGADVLTATARAYNSTLSYLHSLSGVTVDLTKNTASGGDATGDVISGFTNLIGSDYNDVLTGTVNGYVYGGGGNDTIIGDGKTTTAVYSGNFSDYSISINKQTSQITITDLRNGSPDGTDTLTGVAYLKFADSTYPSNAIPSSLVQD